jgi:hypothetical protein
MATSDYTGATHNATRRFSTSSGDANGDFWTLIALGGCLLSFMVINSVRCRPVWEMRFVKNLLDDAVSEPRCDRRVGLKDRRMGIKDRRMIPSHRTG